MSMNDNLGTLRLEANLNQTVINIYSQEIDRLPIVHRNTAAAVLYASVLAVALHSCNGNDTDEANHQCKTATPNDYFDPVSGELKQLTAISAPGLLSCLTKVERAGLSPSSVMNKPTKPLIIDGNDAYGRKTLTSEIVQTKEESQSQKKTLLTEASVDGMRSFELQAMIRLQILRLLQQDGIPLRPSMTAVERGIKETELLTFSSLCSSDLYRSNQLQIFEEMILEKTKNLPNFTGALSSGDGEDGSVLRRKYFRCMSPFFFMQGLSKELVTEPMILKRYYEMTDELLYCLHWPPPNRRNKKDTWRFVFQSDSASSESELKSEEQGTAVNSHNIPSIQMDSVTMTPAGKAIAMLKQINGNHDYPWFTTYYHDCLAGFRLTDSYVPSTEDGGSPNLSTQGIFFIVTDDDVRINLFAGPCPETVKKPDKCGTICLKASYPNGLATTICTNGDICIKSNTEELVSTCLSQQTRSQYASYALLAETSRFIGKNASVCRTFGSNSIHPFDKEILSVDGTREIFLRLDYSPKEYKSFLESTDIFEAYLLSLLPIDVRWITLYPDGRIESCNLAEDNVTWIRNPSISENIMEELIDAETKSVSRYYRDGRLVTLHNDGTRSVLFPDQTHFLVQPRNSMVFLSRGKGWPTVEIDSDVDAVSRSHCQGLEVPINKGGERVRIRVALPDGSAVLVKYDTRVTAKTNGSLKMVSRTRLSILGRDDGTVIFSPSTAWTNEDEESFQKDCKIEDIEPPIDRRLQGTVAANFYPSQTDLATPGIPGQTRPPSTSPQRVSTSMTTANTTKGIGKSKSSAPDKFKANTATSSGKSKRVKMGDYTKVMNTIHDSEDHHQTGHDLFSSNVEPDAVIYADVLVGKCTVKDYEYNSFEMDLAFTRRHRINPPANIDENEQPDIEDVHNKKRETPMDVTIHLAGEVPGLKPPAVARYPKPPKLFVINRNGEATEVLSVQDVSVFEHKVKICPDASRFDATALISPSELGPAKLIRYFTQRRLVTLAEDSFKFSEVYLPRNYHIVRNPASTIHFLQTRANINYCDAHSDLTGAETLPRVFESVSLIERTPLSQQGYLDILASFQRCDEFRTKRIQSIDRFAVDDPRTPDQIEEEEQIIKRLKQAYKVAKINAAKRKEQNKEREDRIAEEDEEDEDGTSQTNSKAAATKGSKDTASPVKKGQKEVTILESQLEDKDEDEEIEEFSDDDENAEVDPEVMITKNAFEDYATPSALASWGGDVMPVSCLQEVFIRVFNRFISQENIDGALSHTEEVEPGLEELTLNEFRAIYRSLKKLLNGESLERPKSASAKTSPRDDGDWGEASDTDLASEITGGSAYIAMMSSPPSAGGPVSRRPVGKSAPPLNLNTLEWNLHSDSASIEHKDSADEHFAAGSAINHIRKVKSHSNNGKM